MTGFRPKKILQKNLNVASPLDECLLCALPFPYASYLNDFKHSNYMDNSLATTCGEVFSLRTQW